MNSNDFKIARLIALYLTGDLTTDQQEELTAWRLAKESNEELFQQTVDQENITEYIELSNKVDVDRGWQQFREQRNKQIRRKWWYMFGRVAAILILPLTILSVHFYTKSSDALIHISTELVAHDIQPGGTQAILKLADVDSTIYLTHKNALELDKESSILSQVEREENINSSSLPSMNTIEIPRGGEYAITLSDGTVVFLNSMSKLVFPTEFSKSERRVQLEGEAFFDVSNSDIPFIVSTREADVMVLGTTFNVSAYVNERYEATLLTGKISLNSPTSSQVLQPNQMASIEQHSSDITIQEVDAQSISEWHRGRIVFQNESLERIMNKLARWYDFEVVYENPEVAKLRFSCAVDKYNEIEPFIKLLKSTKRVQETRVDGKTIYLK